MNTLLAMISKYAGYFHDGAIREIQHDQNSVIISMESAQILSEWDWNRQIAPLSKRDTISGKLHLDNVKSIKENDTPFHKTLTMIYDHGDLFDLEIEKNIVKILITWEQYFTKMDRTDMFIIEIEAEKIYWENIPNLFDPYWDSLYRSKT
jgi:hypothetical protein